MKPIITVYKNGATLHVEVSYKSEEAPRYLKSINTSNVFLSLVKGCLTLASSSNPKDIVFEVDEMTGFCMNIMVEGYKHTGIRYASTAYVLMEALILS